MMSNQKLKIKNNHSERPDGEIGRRAGFRDQWMQIRAGSSPVLGTSLNV